MYVRMCSYIFDKNCHASLVTDRQTYFYNKSLAGTSMGHRKFGHVQNASFTRTNGMSY